MSKTNSISPLLSVCVITYNHNKYIRQCLESILAQETTFEFEIVIGEDCSTDSTLEIIKEFVDSNSRIRLLDSSTNLGVLPNFIRTLESAKGQYLAFCEGDDYWIDSMKLQKQVTFLDEHPQYGGVCTNNQWLLEENDSIRDSILPEGSVTFEELIRGNSINSQSILFRKDLVQDLSWLKDLKMGDWPLHLIITNQKPYYRLSDVTTTYRVHEGGVHSTLNQGEKLRNRIQVLEALSRTKILNSSRTNLINTMILELYLELIALQPKDTKALRSNYL